MGDTNEAAENKSGKVDRLLERYDIHELGRELERRWTADGDERMSLRELAVYFNTKLLEQEMQNVGIQGLDGEADNIYRLLTDDDVNRVDHLRGKRRLERAGVDVERLRTDFVSYQSIRTYLKESRGAEYSGQDENPIESGQKLIQQLRNRTQSVTENKVDQLHSTDRIAADEFQVLVDVQVICETCSTQYDAVTFLERGGCDCE